MKDDGGPAFPALQYDEEATGMTLRDYFAAAALQEFMHVYIPIADPGVDKIKTIATASYQMADAMLEARAK